MDNDATINDPKTFTRMDPADQAKVREATLAVRVFELEAEKLDLTVKNLRLEADAKDRELAARRVALQNQAKGLRDLGVALGNKYGCSWKDLNIETGEIKRSAPEPSAVTAEAVPQAELPPAPVVQLKPEV